MIAVFIFVSSGRFRPCYLLKLYHVPPVPCGFRRSSRSPVAALLPAVRRPSPRSNHPPTLLLPREHPVPSIFPRHYPSPPRISGRRHSRTLGRQPPLPA